MPALDTLLWTQTTASGGKSTHSVLIGYAEATLAGIGSNRDASVIGQEVHVDMGAAAHDETIIYAETLYLQAGALYEFPGKKVTIVARRLGMSSTRTEAAKLSVRGADGPPAAGVTPPPVPQLPKAPRGGDHQDGCQGAKGVPGLPGGAGNHGSPAGNIIVQVFEAMDNLRLDLDASGGAGSPGLPGQDGQHGQDGGDPGPQPKSAAAIIL